MAEDKGAVLERLIKYLAYRKMPFARMERMAGFSNGYLRNNKGAISGTKLAEVIECLPELNGDWLLTGRGEMEIPKEGCEENPKEDNPIIVQGEHATHGRFAGHNYFDGSHPEMDAKGSKEDIIEQEEIEVDDNVVIEEEGKQIKVGIQDLHKRYLELKAELDKLKTRYINVLEENRRLLGDEKNRSDS